MGIVEIKFLADNKRLRFYRSFRLYVNAFANRRPYNDRDELKAPTFKVCSNLCLYHTIEIRRNDNVVFQFCFARFPPVQEQIRIRRCDFDLVSVGIADFQIGRKADAILVQFVNFYICNILQIYVFVIARSEENRKSKKWKERLTS